MMRKLNMAWKSHWTLLQSHDQCCSLRRAETNSKKVQWYKTIKTKRNSTTSRKRRRRSAALEVKWNQRNLEGEAHHDHTKLKDKLCQKHEFAPLSPAPDKEPKQYSTSRQWRRHRSIKPLNQLRHLFTLNKTSKNTKTDGAKGNSERGRSEIQKWDTRKERREDQI